MKGGIQRACNHTGRPLLGHLCLESGHLLAQDVGWVCAHWGVLCPGAVLARPAQPVLASTAAPALRTDPSLSEGQLGAMCVGGRLGDTWEDRANLSWKETTLVQERSVVLGVSDVNTVTAQEELVANMVQASPTGVEDVLAAFAASSADLLVNWSS